MRLHSRRSFVYARNQQIFRMEIYPYLLNMLFVFAYVLAIALSKQNRPSLKKQSSMYTFQQFETLPSEMQIDELGLHGISLDLDCDLQGAESALFAYRDFYVELVVVKHTDEILGVNCFQNINLPEPYLEQINIAEINALLC